MSIRKFFGKDLRRYDGPVLKMGQPLGVDLRWILEGHTLPVLATRTVGRRTVSRLIAAVSQLDMFEALKRCAESRHRSCLGLFDFMKLVPLRHVGTPIAQPLHVDSPMAALFEAMKTPKTGVFLVDDDGHLYRLPLRVILERLFRHSPILIANRPVGRSLLAARKGKRPECSPSTKLIKLALGGIMKSKRRLVLVEKRGRPVAVISPGLVLAEMASAQRKFLTESEVVKQGHGGTSRTKAAKRSPLLSLQVRDILDGAKPAKWALRVEWTDKLDDMRRGKPIWQHLIEREQAFVYRDGKCVGIIHSAWLMAEEILELALRLFYT